MKIRTDFVTNSSSSSFIVVFDKLPESVGEMKELLFGDAESYSNPYNRIGFSAMEVAETVFNDAKPIDNEDELLGLFENLEWEKSYLFDVKDWEAFDKEDELLGLFENLEWEKSYLFDVKDWEAFDKEAKKNAIPKMNNFLEKHKGKTICVFNYGDDDGEYYSALEHGDLFGPLDHVRISNH